MNIRYYFESFNRITMVLITAIMVFFATPIWAVGPVDAVSVPGGVTVVDSDGGAGESWGRVGGRTITYNNFVLANFISLTWRPLNVGMAFDGEINAGSEVMSTPALTGGNTIQWVGQTTINNAVSGQPETVDTRFTLTVLEGIGGPPYETDVLAAGGNLTITLLFEARLTDIGGVYQPALDFFDNFDTPLEDDGKAITSFSSGFFYEVIEGMSIEEHDTNIQDRLDSVDDTLNFLRIDWNGRIPAIQSTVDDNNNLLDWVKIDLQELLDRDFGGVTSQDLDMLSQNIQAAFNDFDLDNISNQISGSQDLLVCMWIGNAFGTCPDVPIVLPNLQNIQTQIIALTADTAAQTTTLTADIAILTAAIAAQNTTFEVTAKKLQPSSRGNAPTFLVLTKLNGLPSDAEIISVQAVTGSNSAGVSAQEVFFSTVAVATGLKQLVLEIPNGLGSYNALLVVVVGTDSEGSTVNGSLLL